MNSLLVSQEHRVVYTPIAKNACTTLKRAFVLLSNHPDSDEILAGDVHSYLTSHATGLSLCDYTPEQATPILRDPGYFRFTAFRNPLDRAVSAYLEKFVVTPGEFWMDEGAFEVIRPAIDWVYRNRDQKPDYDRSITFEEYVSYVTQTDDRELDTHFKSQASFLEHQSIDCHGTVERLGALVDILALRFNRKFRIEHINRTARRKPLVRRRCQEGLLPMRLRSQRTLPHASELLTDEIIGQLNRRYARDLDLWRTAFSGSLAMTR